MASRPPRSDDKRLSWGQIPLGEIRGLAHNGLHAIHELEVPDILTGIDYLVALGNVDEEAIGIMGWSNGSILAIACCIESDRFKVLCAGAGDVNWTSDYWWKCVTK